MTFRDPSSSRQNSQAINLRSGKNVKNPRTQKGNEENIEIEKIPEKKIDENDSGHEEESLQHETIIIPFPKALKEKRKKIVGDMRD